MFSPKASVPRIRMQLQKLRDAARVSEERLLRTVPAVSAWSAAEHLDHLGKVTKSILLRLKTPEVVTGSISVMGLAILTLGWIPRGRGKAPERLRGARVNGDELLRRFDEIEMLVGNLDPAALALSRERIVPHPRFGGLTASEALRFAVVHTDHHLRIIEDIERA